MERSLPVLGNIQSQYQIVYRYLLCVQVKRIPLYKQVNILSHEYKKNFGIFVLFQCSYD